MSRPTVANIDLNAIIHNVDLLSAAHSLGQTIPVIKASAYGHGAISVAKALSSKCKYFAVAFIDEALELRSAGIPHPIILLEGVFSAEELTLCYQHGFIPVLHNHQQIQWLLNKPYPLRPIIWLKADTGMHRLGFDLAALSELMQNERLHPWRQSVVCTHLSSADELSASKTRLQIEAIRHFSATFDCQLSIANSAGIQLWPDSHAQWNRLGIAMYGVLPSPQTTPLALLPAMQLTSRVMALRNVKKGDHVGYNETWTAQQNCLIATVAIGDADGYPRHAKSGTPVIINQQRAKLVGRVSMDMLTVDVTGLTHVEIGDEVELWGKQLAVSEVASHSNTIAYQLLAGLTQRVPRNFTLEVQQSSYRQQCG